MKFISTILSICLMTNFSYANESDLITDREAAVQKLEQVIELRLEIGKLQTQIQEIRNNINKNTVTRNISLVVGAGLLIGFAKISRSGSPQSGVDAVSQLVLFLGTSFGAVTAVGVGADAQYHIVMDGHQLAAIEQRLVVIQRKLDIKKSEIVKHLD